PFMELRLAPPALEVAARSALVTLAYVGFTWLVYWATLPLPAWRGCAFIARNSVIVFLAHMPLYYATAPLLRAPVESYPLGSMLLVALGYLGLAVVSEGVRRTLRPQRLRDRLWTLGSRYAAPPLAVPDQNSLSQPAQAAPKAG